MGKYRGLDGQAAYKSIELYSTAFIFYHLYNQIPHNQFYWNNLNPHPSPRILEKVTVQTLIKYQIGINKIETMIKFTIAFSAFFYSADVFSLFCRLFFFNNTSNIFLFCFVKKKLKKAWIACLFFSLKNANNCWLLHFKFDIYVLTLFNSWL